MSSLEENKNRYEGIIQNYLKTADRLHSYLNLIERVFPIGETESGINPKYNHVHWDFPGIMSYTSSIRDGLGALDLFTHLIEDINKIIHLNQLFPRTISDYSTTIELRDETFQDQEVRLKEHLQKSQKLHEMLEQRCGGGIIETIDFNALEHIELLTGYYGYLYASNNFQMLPPIFSGKNPIIHKDTLIKNAQEIKQKLNLE